MINLHYAITVSTEHHEVIRLVDFLKKNTDDQIIVQFDTTKASKELIDDLKTFDIKIDGVNFNNDFSEFKNALNSKCEENGADYIFQLDADEMISRFLIKNVKEIINSNPEIDLFYIPRINTVNGITREHILKWNWNLDQNNRINFPDYQSRLYKSNLRWKNKVHEKISNAKIYGLLPTEENYCIVHNKNIETQEKQNNFYNSI